MIAFPRAQLTIALYLPGIRKNRPAGARMPESQPRKFLNSVRFTSEVKGA
jgi:hypothetical protein